MKGKILPLTLVIGFTIFCVLAYRTAAENRMQNNRTQFFKDCMVGISPATDQKIYFEAVENCKGGAKAAYPEPI